jgi:hypothetical protein
VNYIQKKLTVTAYINNTYKVSNKMISKVSKYIFRKIVKYKILKKDLKTTFTNIYRINYWGDSESRSGPGSNNKNTINLKKKIIKIIKDLKIKSIVDAPCGDFYWMNNVIANENIKYTGIDIVEELILKNISLYSNKKIKFKRLDITKNTCPPCDLLICRDFLFHLNYNDINNFFKNLSKAKIKYFLTSSHSTPNSNKFLKNKNISSGDFRKINLFNKPFNFPKNIKYIINDNCDGVQKYLLLFQIKNLKKFFYFFDISTIKKNT